MNEKLTAEQIAKWRERSLRDLYWFADFVLGYGDKIPMRPAVHLALCRFLERKTGSPLLDNAWYRKIEMPRETGKSTLARAYAIQKICQNRDIAILLINEKEQLAKDFLQDIKWQFENNELLRALFPELIPKDLNQTTWSATRIIVNRTTGRPDPTVDVIGVGGAVAGKHPDVIIADDMISREAMENARAGSWTIMQQTNRWVNQLDPLVNKSAKPCPEITFIGTRWFYNDSYDYIEIDGYGGGKDEPKRYVTLKAEFDGIVQKLPAYRKGSLAVFRRSALEDGRSIFPDKWDEDRLAEIRMRDPELFAANYLNEPADAITATFKGAWLKHFHWLDENKVYFTDGAAKRQIRELRDLDILVLVDPGGFGQGTGDDRARAAIVVCADDGKGSLFLLDCYSEKDSYLVAIRAIIDFCRKYNPRKVYVERAGQQVAFAQLLRLEIQKAGLSHTVDSDKLKPEGKAKELRVLEMEPYFERGQIYVGTGAAFNEFARQYAQFPRAQRVDVLDVLGYWPRLMRKTGLSPNAAAEQRKQADLAAYRARLVASRSQ